LTENRFEVLSVSAVHHQLSTSLEVIQMLALRRLIFFVCMRMTVFVSGTSWNERSTWGALNCVVNIAYLLQEIIFVLINHIAL
jgi:hypothetical protein